MPILIFEIAYMPRAKATAQKIPTPMPEVMTSALKTVEDSEIVRYAFLSSTWITRNAPNPVKS